MPLNKSKGNMYEFVTHTWNPIKGECSHNCAYCYMKRWGPQNPIYLNEKEMFTNFGQDKFIFIGSSTDIFAENVSDEWIKKVLKKCCYNVENSNNNFFFQTKNPVRLLKYINSIPKRSKICTTIETNDFLSEIMGGCPTPEKRAHAMREISNYFETYVTIEPIMKFDFLALLDIIKLCKPVQVNIGADSGKNNLPEPTYDQIEELVYEISHFANVHIKSNLSRLKI